MKLDSLINPSSGYILFSQRPEITLEGPRNVTRFVFTHGENSHSLESQSAVNAIIQLLADNPELIPLFESDNLEKLVRGKKYLVINENVVCFTKRGGITSSSQLDYVDSFFSYARFTDPVKCRKGDHVFEKEYAELWIKNFQDKGVQEYCPGCGDSPISPVGSPALKVDERLKWHAEFSKNHRDRTVQKELKQKLTGLIRENGKLTVEIERLRTNNKLMRDGIMGLRPDTTPLGSAVKALQAQVSSLPQGDEVIVGPRPPLGPVSPPSDFDLGDDDFHSDQSPLPPAPGLGQAPLPPALGLGQAPLPPAPGLGQAPPPSAPAVPLPTHKALKLCKGEKLKIVVSLFNGEQREALVQTPYYVLGIQDNIRDLTKEKVETAYRNACIRFKGQDGLLAAAASARKTLLKLAKKK